MSETDYSSENDNSLEIDHSDTDNKIIKYNLLLKGPNYYKKNTLYNYSKNKDINNAILQLNSNTFTINNNKFSIMLINDVIYVIHNYSYNNGISIIHDQWYNFDFPSSKLEDLDEDNKVLEHTINDYELKNGEVCDAKIKIEFNLNSIKRIKKLKKFL